jgi:hypothetical protein
MSQLETSLAIPETTNFLSQSDLDGVTTQLGLLRTFISTQLLSGEDFGVIPGTSNKKVLFQPGAQKLARLFNLRCEKACTDRTIDKENGFAMFTYKATVFRGDKIIAECEGSANSAERKYQKQAIPDILNTLQKMAQKRAFVGAILEACAASDFFTQDIEDMVPRHTQSPPIEAKQTPKEPSSSGTCECGNKMMVSKFNHDEWYCGKCKTTKPRVIEALTVDDTPF